MRFQKKYLLIAILFITAVAFAVTSVVSSRAKREVASVLNANDRAQVQAQAQVAVEAPAEVAPQASVETEVSVPVEVAPARVGQKTRNVEVKQVIVAEQVQEVRLAPSVQSFPPPAPKVVQPPPVAQPPQAVATAQAPVVEDERAGVKVYFGVGINYIQYNQNLIEVDTGYRDLRGPTFNVGAEMEITESVGVLASYRTTPIEFENSSVGQQSMRSQWSITSLMAELKGRPFYEDMDIQYQVGMQVHQFPFAMFEYFSRRPQLKDATMINASVGAQVHHKINKKTRAVVNGHLQYTLSSAAKDSAADFSLTPKFIFDGSVGIEKQIKKDLWLGIHWYGQYHSVDFKYRDNLIRTGGTQSIIFSDVELRLLKEF